MCCIRKAGDRSIRGEIVKALVCEVEYAEIGYLLRTDMQSKGIMTEAVRQICGIAFQELELLRITGLVYTPNIASRRVLEKNGFALEGIMRQAVVKPGTVYDLCIYGKLKLTRK